MPERHPNTQDPSTSCWAVFFGVLVHLPQEKSRGPMMNFPSCSCACAVDIATASASTANRSSWYMVLSAHVAQLISSCRDALLNRFRDSWRRSPLAAHVGGLVSCS